MIKKSLMAVALVGAAASVQAATCGSVQREATLDPSSVCVTVDGANGTPKAVDVANQFGGTWTGEGELAKKNGTDGFLTVNVDAWGQDASGTWGISPDFWKEYGEAVITVHVGGGNGDPDWWFFKIVPNATSGNFEYNSTSGGGLSNLFLWGGGKPTTEVPIPGTLSLLGLGFAGLGLVRRKQKA